MIPKLNDYKDLVLKFDYNMKKLRESNHIYDLLDCFLTLNSIPEWIIKSNTASESLKKIAQEKYDIMRGQKQGFILDENLLINNIDHQMRFIRLLCNHTKHITNKEEIPIIQSIPGTTFPMMLPARFCIIVTIGKMQVDGELIAFQASEFWKNEIEK